MLKNKKHCFLLVVTILFVISLIGCTNKNNSSKAIEKKEDIIRVAISPGYYPFIFKENDKLKGFEIDLWNEISKRTGAKIKYECADFSGLFGLLDSDKVDTVSAQISITDKRKEKYNFSVPYEYSGMQLVVKSNNNSINTLNDLKGKTVGIGIGSVANDIVKKQDPENKIKIVNYTSATLKGNYTDLNLGRIDSVFAQDIEALISIKKSNLDLKLVGQPIDYAPIAFPFAKTKKGDTLREKVDKSINDMRKDGTLKKLSNKWIGEDITTNKTKQ